MSHISFKGRDFSSNFPPEFLSGIQNGVMRSVYRGVPFFKSPFDLGIYLKLFSQAVPHTVIEIGSKFGGSALWFSDQMSVHGAIRPLVVSIDKDVQATFSDDRILFLQGEAQRLEEVLSLEVLATLEHPWLVVEDSSHFYEDARAVLEFFQSHMSAGDMIVVEDGIVSQLPGPLYETYKDGPNRAVKEFLNRSDSAYEIATDLCEHYGFNVTYNPNGWLRWV